MQKILRNVQVSAQTLLRLDIKKRRKFNQNQINLSHKICIQNALSLAHQYEVNSTGTI